MGEGDNSVERPRFLNGKIWINSNQYFENVPEKVWEFYIGGYQPARKWLKDRKGQSITSSDINHYQKVIEILHKTDEIMKTIEMTL